MSDEIENVDVAVPETVAAAPVQAAVAAGAPEGDKVPVQRLPRFKKKVCRFCYNKELKIDYKDIEMLEHFITDRGKILPRRITGTCAKHQRAIAASIKRARIIALLPFVEK